LTEEDNICVICEGTKLHMSHPCSFCNATGEWNAASESFLKDHICQCYVWGREFCPICKKICHHDSTATPKQRIVPGYGGMTSTISIKHTTIFPEQEEELILA